MKCSLKDGLVNILLIIFIASSEGVEFPLLLQTNSVIGEPMNFRQFRAVLNRLQDSFPKDVDFENNIHKIVKKQMAISESGECRRKKRSIISLPLGEGDGADVKDFEESKNAMNIFEKHKYATNIIQKDPELLKDIKEDEDNLLFTGFAPTKNTTLEGETVEGPLVKSEKNPNATQHQNSNPTTPDPEIVDRQKPKEKKRSNATIIKENPNLKQAYVKVPDNNDNCCYYEFETNSFGCIKLRHMRCPEGQFFSSTFMKCIKGGITQKKNTEKNQEYEKSRAKRHAKVSKYKRNVSNPNPPEDPDPSNEWLDATQGSRIPPEFKPPKKPELKIYHLIVRKKLNGVMIEKRNAMGGSNADSQRNSEADTGPVKRQEAKTRRSKSFIIHIHKKAGKDESVAESDENDESEDEDEENDDEEDDDEDGEGEGEDEDDESDDEVSGLEITQKSPLSSKDAIKELLKSAKEAVTNRARFDEGPVESRNLQKNTYLKGKRPDINSSIKSKKSDQSENLENKKKKVLIDANIKLDSTIGNALKSVLKGGADEKQVMNSNNDNNTPIEDEALISDRGSQDQMDPELIRMYEHLLRHNPRVKRYFQRNEKKLERFKKSDFVKGGQSKLLNFRVREAKSLARKQKPYFFSKFQRS